MPTMAKIPTAIFLVFLFAASLGQLSTAARLSRKLTLRGRGLSSPVFSEMTPVPTGHSCCSSATKPCSVGCPPHTNLAKPKIVNEVHLASSDHTSCTHDPNNPPHGVCPPHPSSATPEPITEVPMLSSEPPCCGHDKSSSPRGCQPCSPGNANVLNGLVTEVHASSSSSPTCVSHGVSCPPGGIIPPTPHLAGYVTPVP